MNAPNAFPKYQLSRSRRRFGSPSVGLINATLERSSSLRSLQIRPQPYSPLLFISPSAGFRCRLLFPHSRGNHPVTLFVFRSVPSPTFWCGGTTVSRYLNTRRSFSPQSVHSFPLPPGPRYPELSNSPDMIFLGKIWVKCGGPCKAAPHPQ